MKNSKKGISLIVLVITIIVVIILAAAVIISLQNNNPMSEANKARYSSDAANMQAVLVNAIGKAMAFNEEVITIHESSVGENGVAKEIPASDQVSFTLGSSATATSVGVIKFAKGENSTTTPTAQIWYTGKALPKYGGKGTWYIDGAANLKLTVSGTSYGPGAE